MDYYTIIGTQYPSLMTCPSTYTFVRFDNVIGVIRVVRSRGPTMFDDEYNTGPVYLKHRNFDDGRQQPQQMSATKLAELAFNSKVNKGKNISSYVVFCIVIMTTTIILFIVYVEQCRN